MGNFVAVSRESVSRLSDRFTGFIRNVPNHHIYHKSLKEYFYRGKDDKKKVVLDIVARGSYDDCAFGEIAKKLKKITSKRKDIK